MVDLDGSYEFKAPREMLWDMILDPYILARILPGCDKLVIVQENEYQGQMKIQVGPMDGVFRGTVALSDLEKLESFHLVVNGRGPSGVLQGEGDVRLEDSPQGTKFYYIGSGQVSGRMASVGQRVMASSAKAIVKQSLQNLETQVQARIQPAPPSPDGLPPDSAAQAAPPPPSQADFMRGVAENMIEDMIPNPQHRKLLVGLAVLPVLMVLLNLFANLVARRVVKMLQENSGN